MKVSEILQSESSFLYTILHNVCFPSNNSGVCNLFFWYLSFIQIKDDHFTPSPCYHSTKLPLYSFSVNWENKVNIFIIWIYNINCMLICIYNMNCMLIYNNNNISNNDSKSQMLVTSCVRAFLFWAEWASSLTRTPFSRYRIRVSLRSHFIFFKSTPRNPEYTTSPSATIRTKSAPLFFKPCLNRSWRRWRTFAPALGGECLLFAAAGHSGRVTDDVLWRQKSKRSVGDESGSSTFRGPREATPWSYFAAAAALEPPRWARPRKGARIWTRAPSSCRCSRLPRGGPPGSGAPPGPPGTAPGPRTTASAAPIAA